MMRRDQERSGSIAALVVVFITLCWLAAGAAAFVAMAPR
jgi:hypothetical protein